MKKYCTCTHPARAHKERAGECRICECDEFELDKELTSLHPEEEEEQEGEEGEEE